RSVQGGSQRAFHSVMSVRASASVRRNPRTSRQQARNVSTSPCWPATAGGRAARYRRARSTTSGLAAVRRIRADRVADDVAGGGGKSLGVYTRVVRAYFARTRAGGTYL